MPRIIELESGLRFVQLSKVEYENDVYYFVLSLTDEPVYLYLKRGADKSEVMPVEDDELTLKLAELTRTKFVEEMEETAKQAKEKVEKSKK